MSKKALRWLWVIFPILIFYTVVITEIGFGLAIVDRNIDSEKWSFKVLDKPQIADNIPIMEKVNTPIGIVTKKLNPPAEHNAVILHVQIIAPGEKKFIRTDQIHIINDSGESWPLVAIGGTDIDGLPYSDVNSGGKFVKHINGEFKAVWELADIIQEGVDNPFKGIILTFEKSELYLGFFVSKNAKKLKLKINEQIIALPK
jgi:hypothetical protein